MTRYGRRIQRGWTTFGSALLLLGFTAVAPWSSHGADDTPPPPQTADLATDSGVLKQVLTALLQPPPPPPADRPKLSDQPVQVTVPSEPSRAAGRAANGRVKVSPTGLVELHVSNMPIVDVLRLIADQTRRNIVASKDVSGVVSADLYDVPLEAALDAILVGNGFRHREQGDFIYVYTDEEFARVADREKHLQTRVFRLRYVTSRDALTLITPLLSKSGQVSVSPPAREGLEDGAGDAGGSSAASAGGGTGGNSNADVETLVIVDFGENIRRAEEVLKEFDVKPRQVLVEATILRAQLNEDNALGIDFTTVGGVDFTELSSVSPGAQSITTGLVPTERLQDTSFTVRTSFTSDVPAGGFTFGIIKDQVGAFVRALEQFTDTTVLANPKILALNKQRGEVIVGRRDGYLTTTITETTAVQTVEFLETGTRLIFRPFIYDNGFIRMEIHPEDSTGGITAANLPFKQTTEVTTNILVRDGHTILIGGLFREVSGATRGQVPGLGNIPIAGALFRSTSDSLTREEIIILLTVRIVKGEVDVEEGAEALRETERYRVGERRGAQWFGRERLAQAYYRWAVENLSKERIGAALFDVGMATRLNPHNLQAFKLREQLLRRATWDEDGSSVRHHLYRMLQQDQGEQAPRFGRPAPPFRLPEGFNGPVGFDEEEDKPETDTPSADVEAPR